MFKFKIGDWVTPTQSHEPHYTIGHQYTIEEIDSDWCYLIGDDGFRIGVSRRILERCGEPRFEPDFTLEEIALGAELIGCGQST